MVEWLEPRDGGVTKSQTSGLCVRFVKKDLDIMRLRHNEVNFEATFDDHQNY